MKLRQIHINQFGHFTECELALPSDGLQVIYGPNEAGKTTLLQFLRGWLFDFPSRTPYDFKAGAEIAGVGTLQLSDGRTVELRRRKGTKNKISVKIDGQESGLDEAGFQRLIGHANRSLFESIFAFGLDQLSQGEESLKHESLQSALFGGGLGSAVSPERILADLEQQAGELFSPTARKPSINLLLGTLKDLSAQIKAKSLRSDDYLKCRREAAEEESRAAELHQTVDQLRREHGRLEKLCRAWQKWTELQQCLSDRKPLSVPRSLPVDARARYAALSEKIQTCDEESSRLANTIANMERDLSQLKLNPRAVSFRAEIRACLELKQSYLEAKADLPKLKAEHAAARQQIDRELAELRPGWTHDDLRTFVVDVATRAEIDRLSDEDRLRETTLAELRAKREQLSAQLRQARADVEALGELRDVAPLVAVLADESSYSSDRKVLEKRTIEATRIERQLATQLKKLSPPMPAGFQNPHELPVPRIGTIKQFETDFADLQEQLRSLRDSLLQDDNELRDVQEKLDEVVARGVVPSLSERDAARQRRDATWSKIRRRLIEEHETSWFGVDSGALGKSYEQAVREADEIADRIYANADAVVRREELGRQRDLLIARITQKQERAALLTQQQADLQSRWVGVWQACGFVPLDPDAMRPWVSDHETVCETVAKREEIIVESDLLRQQIQTFETRLRSACDSSAEIPVLLVTAHEAVDEAKEQQSRSRELKRDIKRLEPQIAECDAELLALSGRLSVWQEAWKGVLSQLRLPADLDTELTRTVIGRLLATRVKLDSLPQEEERLAAMQARLDEFAARVTPLCEALAADLLRDPPELAAEKLSDQLEHASEAQKQYDQLCKQRDASRDQRMLIEERRTQLITERTDLFSAAEVSSEAEFFEVVVRAEKISQLDTDLEQRTHEIDLIRAGEDREEFERMLNQLQPDILEGQRRDLAEKLNLIEQQKREADGAAAVKRSELARLDGSGDAAILTDELSRKRSHLAADVDRYVPLVFAKHLLSEAVRRFERENQPEMVATVSRLMSQMTAGKYTEFDRTTGTTQGILVRRFDGVERTPDQLSSGTREQLYLAIRLAYVLHYCRQNEPLPIVMDDVLVNFDDGRVRQTVATLAEVAKSVQILFFTCHPHMVALTKEVVPGLQHIDLPTAMTPGASAVSA
ncbi:MAG: AAA family ATPase [Planctomycetaceae bacterium]